MKKKGLKDCLCRDCKVPLIQVPNGTFYCDDCKGKVRKRWVKEWNNKNKDYEGARRRARNWAVKNKLKGFQICIYIVHNREGEIIYVGRTDNFRLRMKRHYQVGSDWLKEVSGIDIINCNTYGDSLVLEALMIRDNQPRFNKDGVTC